MLVEVCANSLQSALNAERGGADRIELCCELGVGGVTPSYGLLKSVRQYITIPVHVLIRPRSGDFTYSREEFEIMKEDIELCAELGFQGIVAGILNPDFTLDTERTKELIRIAKSLKFTFHRAFDWVKNPLETAVQLETLGVDYILSSGQKASALEGIEMLTQLKQLLSTCRIMPGGGVRSTNIQSFLNTGFDVVHLSGTKFLQTLGEIPQVSMNSPSFLKDDQLAVTDYDTIRNIVNAVK